MTATSRGAAVAPPDRPPAAEARRLSARLEPFDSYWQAPADVERGYRDFYQYYKHNFLAHIPGARSTRILVVSCGPGYLVNLLAGMGYTAVLGIDSDPAKVAHATRRGLNCQVAPAFEYLEGRTAQFDAIVCEQELNHLTFDEMIEFLRLCRTSLAPGGTLIVYGLNGANPIVGAENLTHNIDHFNAFTEHSLGQVLEIAGFTRIRPFPLKLYVFWTNPLNYVGLLATGVLSLFFRVCFALYGKKVTILTKKIGAVCYKGA